MPAAILIGASGSGKTTIAHAIAERAPDNTDVLFFDAIGVPSAEDMMREYGSGEAWQLAKTVEWMQRIAEIAASGRRVVFEGQTRLSFLAEGAMAAAWHDYVPILVDCDDATRATRLTFDRQQPELANPEMMDWANYLRGEARAHGCEILDTSAMSVEQAASRILSFTLTSGTRRSEQGPFLTSR
ncbi:shikimate kinase [Rhizobium binae]|uniref:Shikimate kinase n=1 Tax=Rhizobium binae TaxID=1138190 RepID=A0ABV2MLU9_9HYPH|nr:AAA family ATPase [Rhizobium binae]NKL50932.1 AAA family ATPase [Rhizobium leguminosarum bv. viciae]MBX4949717.1 AAA family ATPase [Rhizobium binae]MBX4966809.1 AAA family ATPase [Rhizobium binae]MBX4994397.1 AAA family ATPase [Rhizobium binae]QSY84520.1 AAA family ATPase [Rhizobium binae]